MYIRCLLSKNSKISYIIVFDSDVKVLIVNHRPMSIMVLMYWIVLCLKKIISYESSNNESDDYQVDGHLKNDSLRCIFIVKKMYFLHPTFNCSLRIISLITVDDTLFTDWEIVLGKIMFFFFNKKKETFFSNILLTDEICTRAQNFDEELKWTCKSELRP